MRTPPAPGVPPLTGPLAERYRVQQVTAADTADLFALASACDVAVLGYPDTTLADTESDAGAAPGGTPRPQALVRDAASGRAVGWWWTEPHEGSQRFTADVYTAPELDEPDGDAVTGAGWAAVEAWARAWFADHGVTGGQLATGSLHGDVRAERSLRAAGFERVRTFWRMTADVPASGPPVPVVPGLRVVGCQDSRRVHALSEAAFAEHWGHEREEHDAWIARWRARAGFDPTLWFVAEIDGEAAGFLLASRRMAQENALYVALLGTLAAYRRRGVAAALLRHAFEVARREGFEHLRLGVDSDNPTGAPALYRQAGLEVMFATHAWRKDLD